MIWMNRMLLFTVFVIVLGPAINNVSFAGDIDNGMIVYQSSCAHCHGLQGDGNGPEAANYSPKPTTFTSSQMYTLTDPMIERAVVVGLPGVPMHNWGNKLSS